jgi:hypothetical protein
VANSAVVNSAEGAGERTLKEKGGHGGERAREWRSLMVEDEVAGETNDGGPWLPRTTQ